MMKKSVITLILVMFIISIVVVTFFGTQIEIDQFKVYMSKVEITTFDQKVHDKKIKTVNWDAEQGFTSIFIEYIVGPENATEQDQIKFILTGNTYTEDGKTEYYAQISPIGELVFFKAKTVTVTIYTLDGSSLSDSVMVRCVQPK